MWHWHREREFVQAALALGADGPRILARHLRPNVLSVVALGVNLLGDALRDRLDPRGAPGRRA